MIKPSWDTAQTYIAGKKRKDALEIAHLWNHRGASVILNLLGEHLRTESTILTALREYLAVISEMQSAEILGSVAIKPSQLGLELEPKRKNFDQNLRRILDVSSDAEIFIWVDMEFPKSVEPTLEVFQGVLRDFGPENLGVCLQANLQRTPNDLEALIKHKACVRLVKGIYQGEPGDMLPPGSKVEDAFRQLMIRLFETCPRFVLGTHDPILIEESLLHNQKYKRVVEWEMLMGVSVERQLDLLAHGVPFGVYIPYGSEWEPYVRRRMLERYRSEVY
ncbi:MAG: proline dehydrogenase family protein [Candidatus Hodarchaeota archaeon]